MHTYQHLLPGMSAAAAEQFANLVAAAEPVDVYRLDRPRNQVSGLDSTPAGRRRR